MKHCNIILCFLYVAQLQAQQKPQYTQFLMNQYLLNPAITGIENYTDVKLGHRQQWSGLSGGPASSFLTVQMPLGKKDFRTNANSFQIPGENPRGRAYWEEYMAAEPHQGIGLQFINDQAGPISNTSAYATYAYHIGISAKTNLAAGLGLGFNRYGINSALLDYGNTVPDPTVYAAVNINKIKPDLMAGLYLYAANYFLGGFALQLLPAPLDFSNESSGNAQGRTVPHFFLTSGYRFLLTDDLNCTAALLLKKLNNVPMQWETHAKLQYRDLLWTGIGYRKNDGISALLGLNLANTVQLAYSYDYSAAPLSYFHKGSHELVLGFILGNNYGDTCPRNLW